MSYVSSVHLARSSFIGIGACYDPPSPVTCEQFFSLIVEEVADRSRDGKRLRSLVS